MEKQKNRYILKISGESFQSGNEDICFQKYDEVAKQILEIVDKTNIQLAMVVGGGNIFRGRERGSEVDSSEADSMGMLATVINGLALREAFVRNGAPDTRLMTALHMQELAEPYIRMKGRHHMENDRLIILAGGLGKPGFSTDSAVAQYADELLCSMVLKASTVDGVYDSDPKNNPEAVKYETLSYKEALIKDLKIMDTTAFAMCMRSNTPIFVFNIEDLHKLPDLLKDDYSFGTLVK